MTSYTVIVKAISEHIIMVTSILHFGKKKIVVFERKKFISQNYRSFTETTVMVTLRMH